MPAQRKQAGRCGTSLHGNTHAGAHVDVLHCGRRVVGHAQVGNDQHALREGSRGCGSGARIRRHALRHVCMGHAVSCVG